MKSLIVFLIVLILSIVIPQISYEQVMKKKIPKVSFVKCTTVKLTDNFFGDISGIDYDPGTNKYYFIPDMEGACGARIYRGSINFDSDDPVTIDSVFHFKTSQFSGEGIHINIPNHKIFWLGEGEGGTAPFVEMLTIERNATTKKRWNIPGYGYKDSVIKFKRGDKGFEGLSAWGNTLFISTEQPVNNNGIHILGFSIDRFQYKSTYYYPPDNGINTEVSEILAVGPGNFLILERYFDVNNDIMTNARVMLATKERGNQTLRKEQLFNFSESLSRNGISRVENIEGMCFGQPYKDGSKRLIVISDNNKKCGAKDDNGQETQLWELKVQ